jgi:DNA-binding NarL/FixJ family response regulator
LEAVEELNDHLCYYISFLIENLPELIIKTIQSSDDIDFLIEKSHGKFHTNGALENKSEFPLPTRREHDVLELLERGLCAKEIATRLYISETTVITHKKNLKKKFNVKNTAELISKIRSGT